MLDGVTLQPLVEARRRRRRAHGGGRLEVLRRAPRCIAAGSHDLVVDIYDVQSGYAPLSRCRGHQATITNLDWSLPDFARGGRRVLQSTCASYELLYWDPLTESRSSRTSATRFSAPLVRARVPGDGHLARRLGRHGHQRGGPRARRSTVRREARDVWDEAVRGARVVILSGARLVPGGAAAERAGYVVTADDFGKIKLFNYPCVFNDAPYREYKGHASHAMCARFTCDDRRVITAGGRDRAMLQFVMLGRAFGRTPAYEPPPPRRTVGAHRRRQSDGLDRARAGREGNAEAGGGKKSRAAASAAGDDGLRRGVRTEG